MSKLKIAQYIEQTNKAFEAASPELKRIMIAQDVILRIEKNIFHGTTGSFLNNLTENGSLKKKIIKRLCK